MVGDILTNKSHPAPFVSRVVSMPGSTISFKFYPVTVYRVVSEKYHQNQYDRNGNHGGVTCHCNNTILVDPNLPKIQYKFGGILWMPLCPLNQWGELSQISKTFQLNLAHLANYLNQLNWLNNLICTNYYSNDLCHEQNNT